MPQNKTEPTAQAQPTTKRANRNRKAAESAAQSGDTSDTTSATPSASQSTESAVSTPDAAASPRDAVTTSEEKNTAPDNAASGEHVRPDNAASGEHVRSDNAASAENVKPENSGDAPPNDAVEAPQNTTSTDNAAAAAQLDTQQMPRVIRSQKKKKKKYQFLCGYRCETCDKDFEGVNKKKDITRDCFGCSAVLTPLTQVRREAIPFQPKGRCFGYYRCEDCDKRWTSAYSWAGFTQKCKECDAEISPYNQRALFRGRGTGNNKSHLDDLCGKCKALGYKCARANKEPTGGLSTQMASLQL